MKYLHNKKKVNSLQKTLHNKDKGSSPIKKTVKKGDIVHSWALGSNNLQCVHMCEFGYASLLVCLAKSMWTMSTGHASPMALLVKAH